MLFTVKVVISLGKKKSDRSNFIEFYFLVLVYLKGLLSDLSCKNVRVGNFVEQLHYPGIRKSYEMLSAD